MNDTTGLEIFEERPRRGTTGPQKVSRLVRAAEKVTTGVHHTHEKLQTNMERDEDIYSEADPELIKQQDWYLVRADLYFRMFSKKEGSFRRWYFGSRRPKPLKGYFSRYCRISAFRAKIAKLLIQQANHRHGSNPWAKHRISPKALKAKRKAEGLDDVKHYRSITLQPDNASFNAGEGRNRWLQAKR